jgi:hypothetical protein
MFLINLGYIVNEGSFGRYKRGPLLATCVVKVKEKYLKTK